MVRIMGGGRIRCAAELWALRTSGMIRNMATWVGEENLELSPGLSKPMSL